MIKIIEDKSRRSNIRLRGVPGKEQKKKRERNYQRNNTSKFSKIKRR